MLFFFFQAEDGIRDAQESRGLGDVYKRQLIYMLDSVKPDLLAACEQQDPGMFKETIQQAALQFRPTELMQGTSVFCEKLDDGWDFGREGTFSDMYYHFYKMELQSLKKQSQGSNSESGAELFSNLSWRGRFEGTMTANDKDWMEGVMRAFEKRMGPERQTFDLKEFETVMTDLLPQYRHDHLPLPVLFKVLDTDGSSTVSLGEVCMGLALMLAGSLDEKVSLCFRIFDSDCKGYLKLKEVGRLSRIIARIVWGTSDLDVADAEAEKMFTTMDVNGDGQVSLGEFSKNTAMHPAVLAFFREVGIAQQHDKAEQVHQSPGVPNQLTSSELSVRRVANQLKKFLPGHRIRQLEPLLQKHVLATGCMSPRSSSADPHQVSRELHQMIGKEVLHQATELALVAARENDYQGFSILGSPGGELMDEQMGLLAGESELLSLDEINLVLGRVEMRASGSKQRMLAQLSITSYRILIKFGAVSPGVGAIQGCKLSYIPVAAISKICLLYTSDAADEEDSVDLGGRRIIKKKKKNKTEDAQSSIKLDIARC
eukprot:TRINITY_DN27683_c0_g1_i1.p1 TRINITY_DN27683_c0_g1~~TRINITY_DN27683_c0_g1_i1.p1  ORF type:complete len:542 (+),score=157.94 TRINITY_DN27683_c0_g1_i1:102-1727(+)